jgi:polyisoprenoid-binding protein YceI
MIAPPSGLTRTVNHQEVPAAGIYRIDAAHTFADFTAQHLVVGHVRGRFTQLTGQITIAEDLAQSAVAVSIAAASIDTHVAKRDQDLRSARYLDVGTYPAITFASTRLAEYPGNQWGLHGDLTIKNITCPVELLTQFTGAAIDDFGYTKIAFLAQAKNPGRPGCGSGRGRAGASDTGGLRDHHGRRRALCTRGRRCRRRRHPGRPPVLLQAV